MWYQTFIISGNFYWIIAYLIFVPLLWFSFSGTPSSHVLDCLCLTSIIVTFLTSFSLFCCFLGLAQGQNLTFCFVSNYCFLLFVLSIYHYSEASVFHSSMSLQQLFLWTIIFLELNLNEQFILYFNCHWLNFMLFSTSPFLKASTLGICDTTLNW